MLWHVVLCGVLFIPCSLETWAARVCWVIEMLFLKGRSSLKCAVCPEGQCCFMAVLCCRVINPHPVMVLEVSRREHSHCPSYHWSLSMQGAGIACPKEIGLGTHPVRLGAQLEVLVGECLACETSGRAVCRGDPLPLYQTLIQNPRKGFPPSPCTGCSPLLSLTHPSLVL